MRIRILKPSALALLAALSSCSSVQNGTDLTKSQTSTQTSEMAQPSFHTKGTPTGKPTGPLKPGEMKHTDAKGAEQKPQPAAAHAGAPTPVR